ncbi:ABC transporter permease [Nocardioides insulae]|uniref:ABC transporter permease n=1 Tax=Nocardioides insulae TaxID=394734 RepID=UPI0004150635|nr:ABC transporter permease [Nocardioides insulae]
MQLLPQLHLIAGLLVLALVTAGLARLLGAGLGWQPVWALVRAGVQLAVVALLLRGVLAAPYLVLGFVALMLTTASWTSGTRTAGLWRRRRTATAGVLAGAFVSLGLILAMRLVDWEARYIIAVAGIVIGAAMSAATLSGRRFVQSSIDRRDELEGWLALGATPAQAHRDLGRTSVRESVLPNLDQTRSTGLVTLPGAFVGALFGGASPLEAANFQLVVLAGVVLAMVVTAGTVTTMAGRTPYLPETPR